MPCSKSTNDCSKVLAKAVEDCINYKFPEHKLKSIKDSKYIFNIGGEDHVLMCIWTDWKAYCTNPGNINIGNNYSNWAQDSTDISINFYNKIKNIKLIKTFVKDATFMVMADELIENLEKLKKKNDRDILRKLKRKFGFPWSHKTSYWFSFVLFPVKNIYRPTINGKIVDNTYTSKKFDINLLGNSFHDQWLKIWYNNMVEDHNRCLNDGTYNNTYKENSNSRLPYPFSGNGYTIDWDNNEKYGFTEFIARNPNLSYTTDTNGKLVKFPSEFDTANQIPVYSLGCMYNSFKDFIRNRTIINTLGAGRIAGDYGIQEILFVLLIVFLLIVILLVSVKHIYTITYRKKMKIMS